MSIPQLDTTFLKSSVISSIGFFIIFFILVKLFLSEEIHLFLKEDHINKDNKNYIHQLQIENEKAMEINQQLHKKNYEINEEIQYLKTTYTQEQLQESHNQQLKIINNDLKNLSIKIKNNNNIQDLINNN